MNGASATIPTSRNDRVTLRSPRMLNDGSVVFDAVLAVAGRPLEYEWGTETPTAEALSDSEYLDALRGLSVLYQHPTSGLVEGSAPREGHGRRMGTVLGARYEADTGEVVVELAIPEASDQDAIRRGLREVSEGYIPELETRDGATYQVKRRPNHVAVTERGRAEGARIRVDAGEYVMDQNEMYQKLAEMYDMLKSIFEYTDSMKAKMDQSNKDEEKMVEAVVAEMGDEVRSDAAAFRARLDARIRDEVKACVALRLRADALDIKLPESAETASDLRKALALALGGDAARCDSADYCDGIIAGAKAPESATVRGDSVNPNSYPV